MTADQHEGAQGLQPEPLGNDPEAADVAEADRANGEPDAQHPTGERQAQENRENEPPA